MTTRAQALTSTYMTTFGDPILDDFRNFLFLCWEHLGLPEPTAEQYDIADYLQNGPRRKMIKAFRGVGKSWIYGAFACWRLLRNPDWKIVCVSASKAAADALAQFVKRLIDEMPILQHLRPRPEKGQRDSVIVFDVGPSRTSKDPSFKSVGITGQITGSRSDEVIADDIETTNNSMTHASRELLLERIKEFAAISKPETGYITYLGTPQSEQSIYNELPGRGYEIRVWPARIPVDVDKYKGTLAPFIMDLIARGAKPGDPVSKRFNDLKLAEAEAEYMRAGFALQFMLDTSLSDADRYPLKLADLMVNHLDPDRAPIHHTWCNDPQKVWENLPNVGLLGDRMFRPMQSSDTMADYTGCVMAIDPSGRGKDETGYAVVKILHGYLYLVDAGGFRDGYSEDTLKALAVVAKTHKVNFVRVESNYGDGMFTQLLKPVMAKIHPVTIEEEKSLGQKEARIADVLEPVLLSHKLIVDAKLVQKDANDVNGAYSLFYQMTRLTRDRGALRHDDRLDALSMAVGYWTEQMGRDSDKAAAEHLERLRDQQLQDFVDGILGADAHSDCWMDA